MTKTEAGHIQIVVNGEIRAVPERVSLLQVLQFLGIDSSRVAVEKDRFIIRKTDWGDTPVQPGAELEIVQFVGGG